MDARVKPGVTADRSNRLGTVIECKPASSWWSLRVCCLSWRSLRQRAQVYGAIRAALEIKGEMIGNNDLRIAARARAAGLILVTTNKHEFRAFKD
jgi:hypothetical protein